MGDHVFLTPIKFHGIFRSKAFFSIFRWSYVKKKHVEHKIGSPNFHLDWESSQINIKNVHFYFLDFSKKTDF